MSTDRYTSPLSERLYQQRDAVYFSRDIRFPTTWRSSGLSLAELEMELWAFTGWQSRLPHREQIQ